MRLVEKVWNWFYANWERALFIALGLVFFLACLDFLWVEKVTEAAAAFGLGFLSFAYSNLSRFKRIKGFGVEMELWEDAQKQAVGLIERLRNVIAIYSRELVMRSVSGGRWSSGDTWSQRWKLYDDLVAEHSNLGVTIDFADLKKQVDDYFLLDMTWPQIDKVARTMDGYRSKADEAVRKEFGSPIKDAKAYSARISQLQALPQRIPDPFSISQTADLAGRALKDWDEFKMRLKRDFSMDAEVDQPVIERLAAISKLYQNRPVTVTPELIRWTEPH